jgi:hypothetical protein
MDQRHISQTILARIWRAERMRGYGNRLAVQAGKGSRHRQWQTQQR